MYVLKSGVDDVWKPTYIATFEIKRGTSSDHENKNIAREKKLLNKGDKLFCNPSIIKKRHHQNCPFAKKKKRTYFQQLYLS